MITINTVIDGYGKTAVSGQDFRQVQSVIKKACVANGFPNWEVAPLSNIKREALKEFMIKEGLSENSIKTNLYHFDKFMGYARTTGAVFSAADKKVTDPVLKSEWTNIEKACNNVVVIQKLAGYSIARNKHPKELAMNFLLTFCSDCTVAQSTLSKYWNELFKKGLVSFEFVVIPRNVCYHSEKFTNLGKCAQTFEAEWKKICNELGSTISGKRNPKCTGANETSMDNRKRSVQCFLWWYLDIKITPQERQKLLADGNFTLQKLLQVGEEHHKNVEEFARYGENKLAWRSLFVNVSNIFTVLCNYYYDPAKDLSTIMAQLKSKFDIYEIPSRYQKKMEQVSLEDIKAMIRGLDVQMNNAKIDIEKARLCRDIILVSLLACHMLRRSTIARLRIGGQKSNFECVQQQDGTDQWFLILFPKDHKTGRTSKTFELIEIIKGAHENWVKKYRPILMNGKKHDSYLIKDDGNPVSKGFVYTSAIGITSKMLGVAISPHLFRHLIASELITRDERNLIAVSKALLHRSVDFTARMYLKYDEKKASQKIKGEWDIIR